MPRIRLGILTPSSNTALEPLSQEIISQLPHVSVHFSRFSVVKIDMGPNALIQFQTEKIVEAAKLLADANVHVIGWSGTSAGWMGFWTDEELCAAITAATGGIPVTTSVLALNRAVRILSAKQLGLVTPYVDQVQTTIVQNYRSIGVDCSLERHFQLSQNTAFAEIEESTLDEMVADVVREGATVVSTFCTNLRAAQRVAYWERVHGIIVLDTVSTVIWEMLLMCNGHPQRIRGWGKLFQLQEDTCSEHS